MQDYRAFAHLLGEYSVEPPPLGTELPVQAANKIPLRLLKLIDPGKDFLLRDLGVTSISQPKSVPFEGDHYFQPRENPGIVQNYVGQLVSSSAQVGQPPLMTC